MTTYLPLIISFIVGMGIFGLLRQRDKDPILSGAAAMFLSMVVVIGYFAFAISTGRL